MLEKLVLWRPHGKEGAGLLKIPSVLWHFCYWLTNTFSEMKRGARNAQGDATVACESIDRELLTNCCGGEYSKSWGSGPKFRGSP